MKEPGFDGGCLCGAVRFRVAAPPLLVEYCHCGMCRRACGAPVVVWADFPSAAVTWMGTRPEYRQSSPRARRGFCPHCGTPLAYAGIATPGRVSLTVGSMDRPEALTPQHHIYVADALPWLRLEDDLPRYAGELDVGG